MNPLPLCKLPKRDRGPDSPDIDETLHKNKHHKTVSDLKLALCMDCQTLDPDASFEDSFKIYQQANEGSTPLTGDIHQAYDGRYFYHDAIFIHQFGTRLSTPSDCTMCGFFRSLRVQAHLHKRHKLLAFRSSHHWLFKTDLLKEKGVLMEYKDTAFMAVVPDVESIPLSGYEVNWLDHDIPAVGAIYRLQVDESSSAFEANLLKARELDDKADLDRVRFWLDMCRRKHGSACKQRTSHEPISKGFRLINCMKNPPVIEDKPWGTMYAVLSYVWGSGPEDGKDWPETVLDAVEVTRKSGLTYLWVDRSCINQSSPVEKNYLISRMKTVYEEAEFTIVAAAGHGASYGLPGVRSTTRNSQPKYHLDSGSLLLSILRDPRRDILESQYWTRGWTYQEGVLSNRHVVFTDTQVYWECRCMAAQESADMTLFHNPASHKDHSGSVMADFMLTGIFKHGAYSGGSSAHLDDLVIHNDEAFRIDYGFPINATITVGAQLRGLNEHIREFSRRHLTYDTDTLPAFQGIVGLYEQTKPLCLLHGIPVWTGDIAGCASGAQVTFALSVSSWYHRTSPDQSMFVSESCKRKTHLPSWTWAGWGNTVSWRAPPHLEHCAYMSDLIKAREPCLVWTADIYLNDSDRTCSVQLLEMHSTIQLRNEALTLLEIKDPFLLSSWKRIEDTERKWGWHKSVGRPGREEVTSQRIEWDERWYRIGGRLSFVSTSVAMNDKQWTEKHMSGELISVLIFAGRFLTSEHGTARFLTLRRVDSADERWERIGTVYLILPFLADCKESARLFWKIPARKQEESIVIQ